LENTKPAREKRVDTSAALGRYLAAVEQLAIVSREFDEACVELRQQLDQPSRFVWQRNYRHYLVTSEGRGEFEVEEIALL
jgi:hypothetical protein